MYNHDLSRSTEYKFNSMSEFGHHFDRIQPRRGNAAKTASSKWTANSAANGMSLGEAIDLAKRGGAWVEGARDLQKITFKDSDFTTETFKRTTVRDVAGGVPLIPLHLIGVPDCMLNSVKKQTQQKIIKIGINVGRSFAIAPDTIMNRGKALLACIDKLEELGYSCELWAVWRNSDKQSRYHGNISVCIKNAGESYSPANVAFAVCSGAFQKRLCWRTIESDPKAYNLATKLNRYGHGGKADMRDFDVAFPYLDKRDGDLYHTPACALRTVERAIEKKLKALVS